MSSPDTWKSLGRDAVPLRDDSSRKDAEESAARVRILVETRPLPPIAVLGVLVAACLLLWFLFG